MFESRETFDDQPNEALAALPHRAIQCLRACTCADHARAQALRQGHQKRPAPRLHVASKRTEVRARELAWEAR